MQTSLGKRGDSRCLPSERIFHTGRSEKVKLRGLYYVAYKMCQCAVLLKDKIIIRNVFSSYSINVLLRG